MKKFILITLAIYLMVFTHMGIARTDIKIQALFTNKVMAIVNGKKRMLVAGKPSREGVLLIKSNSDEAQIKVDGEVKTYRLNNAISTVYKKRKNAEITLWADDQDMFQSQGKINGKRVHFLVDTGATYVAMSEGDAKRLGIDYKKGSRGYARTANGVVSVWNIMLDSVELGPIKVNYVEGSVIQGNLSTQILLGMSFLSKLKMTRSGKSMKLVKKY